MYKYNIIFIHYKCIKRGLALERKRKFPENSTGVRQLDTKRRWQFVFEVGKGENTTLHSVSVCQLKIGGQEGMKSAKTANGGGFLQDFPSQKSKKPPAKGNEKQKNWNLS